MSARLVRGLAGAQDHPVCTPTSLSLALLPVVYLQERGQGSQQQGTPTAPSASWEPHSLKGGKQKLFRKWCCGQTQEAETKG